MGFKNTLQTLKFIKNYRSFLNASDEIAKDRAYSFLKEMFGENLGVFSKFLQYQGTKSDSEYDFLLGHEESLDGVEYEEILTLLKTQLGDKFSHFSDISHGAQKASVGQVHSAYLVDQKVAIKVQYPNIRKTFEEQFSLLNLLPKGGLKRKWGVEFDEYQKMFENLLEKELDYKYEANQLIKWKDYLKEDTTFFVPEVLSTYSSQNILVTEFIEGKLIDHLEESELNKFWSKELWRSFFELLFHHQVIQGDSNHGNYIFQQESKKIFYLDMAQSLYLSSKLVRTIRIYIQERLLEREVEAFDVFCKLGFDPKKMKQIQNKLELILDLLTEPFFSNLEYDLRGWDYKKRLDIILGEDKWWFRSAGPTEFFLLMKAFTGMKNLSQKLSPKIFIKPALENILKKFPNEEWVVIYKQDQKIEKSKLLRVTLWRNGIEKVRIKVPFNALFDLDLFLSKETVKSITDYGYNLDKIVRDAVGDGGKPKNLIDYEDDEVKIQVDLIK